jgi:hypothetical protein
MSTSIYLYDDPFLTFPGNDPTKQPLIRQLSLLERGGRLPDSLNMSSSTRVSDTGSSPANSLGVSLVVLTEESESPRGSLQAAPALSAPVPHKKPPPASPRALKRAIQAAANAPVIITPSPFISHRDAPRMTNSSEFLPTTVAEEPLATTAGPELAPFRQRSNSAPSSPAPAGIPFGLHVPNEQLPHSASPLTQVDHNFKQQLGATPYSSENTVPSQLTDQLPNEAAEPSNSLASLRKTKRYVGRSAADLFSTTSSFATGPSVSAFPVSGMLSLFV